MSFFLISQGSFGTFARAISLLFLALLSSTTLGSSREGYFASLYFWKAVLDVMLKAFDLNNLLISSASFKESCFSKACLRASKEKFITISQNQRSWSLLASILDLMRIALSAPLELSGRLLLLNTIQAYMLARRLAFSKSFFFSDGSTQGTARPLCLASTSKTCYLFSSLNSSRQYSSSDSKKLQK